MNFVKRASFSVRRRASKTGILLLLIMILGTMISGALSIQQAVENAEKNLKRQLPAVVTIEPNPDKIFEHYELTNEPLGIGPLTIEVIKEIGELPYVSYFDYFIDTITFSRELVPYKVDEQKMFFLKGVNNPEIIDIKEGVIKLIQGRTFTDEEVNLLNDYRSVTLISKNLAETNNLGIGSMISIESNVYGDGAGGQLLFEDEHLFASRLYELEVVGIFELAVDIDLGEEWLDEAAMTYIENRIYVPGPVAEDHVLFNNEQYDLMTEDEPYILDNRINLSNIFVLEDPLEMQNFRESVIKIIPDSEWYLVEDLSNTYSEISHSMETMQWLASQVTRVSIGLGILILNLLITLFLRDRKHEIGIYLALGERKIKIVCQIMIEVLAIALVGITLALFTGNLLSRHISETMIRNDLISSQETTVGATLPLERQGFYHSPTQEEMINSYQVSLSAEVVSVFYGVGMLTVLFSTLYPVGYILRLNPKKILM